MNLPSDKEDFNDFLRKEYERNSDLFKENENLSEGRVTPYLTLITSLVGALGITTILSNLTVPGAETLTKRLLVFTLFILSGLFVYGLLALRRIVYRNVVTNDYKVKLDLIRKYFCINMEDDMDK